MSYLLDNKYLFIAYSYKITLVCSFLLKYHDFMSFEFALLLDFLAS